MSSIPFIDRASACSGVPVPMLPKINRIPVWGKAFAIVPFVGKLVEDYFAAKIMTQVGDKIGLYPEALRDRRDLVAVGVARECLAVALLIAAVAPSLILALNPLTVSSCAGLFLLGSALLANIYVLVSQGRALAGWQKLLRPR